MKLPTKNLRKIIILEIKKNLTKKNRMKSPGLKLLLVFIGLTTMSYAQKIATIEGDIDALKGVKFFNIEYDYSEMRVGKYENEEDYVTKKQSEYNERYKVDDPGKGDRWKENWYGDRAGRFQPMFEELLNKYLKKPGIFVGNEKKGAKYTMLVHTTFTEPGFNIYITKKPAMINVTVSIVETANLDNVICVIVSKNNPGRSYGMGDFDTGLRISEAYAMAGKGLAKYLAKALK